MQINLPGAK